MRPWLSAGPERGGHLAVLLCAVAALANLPPQELPLAWALAWTLPAASLGILLPRLVSTWSRAMAVALLQGGAVALAWWFAPPLSRPASLACTILPPLAFVAVRRDAADAALSLFLSFCVLLVGTILGGFAPWHVAAYGVGAAWCLRRDAALAAVAASRGLRHGPVGNPPVRVLRPGLWLAGAALATAVVLDQGLAILPSPVTGPGSGFANERGGNLRSVGLGDSFVLDSGQGLLGDLHGEHLVTASMPDGSEVPNDLYLRSWFFTIADLDRWQLGPLDLSRDEDGELELRRPLAPGQVRWLELERYSGAQKFVFAPPATFAVRGVGNLTNDPAREFLWQGDLGQLEVYEVGYQVLPPPPPDLPFDPRASRQGLLQLPADLDVDRYRELLTRWQVDGPLPQRLTRLAEGLASHCRYDRAKPAGPHRLELDNFLFAPGDRHGYCMHFASAAALLLRLSKVPCRIGVGLYGGGSDPVQPGARRFGSQHAHAWVEIPFAGRGFVVFDPTPPAERGTPRAATPAPLQPLDDAPTAVAAGPFWPQVWDVLSQPWVLAVALLLALGYRLRPGEATLPTTVPTPPSLQTARRHLARILRALAALGLPRERGQTLEAYGRNLRLADSYPEALHVAFATYQEVRFGGRSYDAGRIAKLAAGLAATEALPALTARRSQAAKA